MLKRVGVLVLALSVLTFFSLSASGRILFEDDFEADDIGDEPSKWEIIAGYNLFIEEDPDDPGNKVLTQVGESNGKGVPAPIGWEDQDFWTDYIWEFDWMWPTDSYVSMSYRYQSSTAYYNGSRRQGGAQFILFAYKGGWNNLQGSEWLSEINVWYRMQVTAIGEEQTIKGKERADDTPFEDIDPIVSVEDSSFDEGPIALSGADGSVYWDNIIVYEPGTDIQAVKPEEKLATTWGRLKVK